MASSFFKKDDYDQSDLAQLIENQIEESLNLDYKSARALDKTDKKKNELAKDVSAFANSDGGILIYGIEEQNHKPVEFSFVDGNTFTKEWIENVIDGNIQQKIHGINIFPIRFDNDIEKTIYLIKIPSSQNAPHISSDKKYYRRYNFKSVPMEEYEIRLLYNRRSNTKLRIERLFTHQPEIYDNRISFKVSVVVKNIGEVIEKHCKFLLTIKCPKKTSPSISYSRDSNIRQGISPDNRFLLTAHNETPIFPEEELTIMAYELHMLSEHYHEFKKEASMGIQLFYSSGEISGEANFNDFESLNPNMDN